MVVQGNASSRYVTCTVRQEIKSAACPLTPSTMHTSLLSITVTSENEKREQARIQVITWGWGVVAVEQIGEGKLIFFLWLTQI
jgi:hypothetical protein